MLRPQLLSEWDGNQMHALRALRAGGVWLQPKIDGIRCMVTRSGDAYGRSGALPLWAIAPEVAAASAGLRSLPEGIRGIDGELHAPGVAPDEIGRAIIAGKAIPGLRLAVFDAVGPDRFSLRFEAAANVIKNQPSPAIELVPTFRVNSKAEIDAFAETTRASGGEGVVIRTDGFYAEGQRQRHCLKLKFWTAAYGKVIGLKQQSVQIQPEDAPAFWVKAPPQYIMSTRIGDRADYRYCGRAKTGTPLNAAIYW